MSETKTEKKQELSFVDTCKNYSINALAFLGDGIFELYIRKAIVMTNCTHGDVLHRVSSRFVCASAQAKAIKALFESLTEEEQSLVKRARNHKVSTKAKNADIVTYKWATGFEALLGALNLSGEHERLKEIMTIAKRIIES